ncbi:hypothetical protein [Amycolatopsis sp. Hca4]|uniref:hypothetical protein n=1 Tax=unclassified Amycolatopsis TaxID=2618356 RepID=UPI0015924D24|nr:hypothetical protein [Amycolatopsis sp. Hca4]QKV72437.1 hypothetical protein HUT10_00200 [Amycolatopsis sp. Hca4]
MPAKPEPPKTGIALLDSVLGDAARTRRAVCLLLAAAVSMAVALIPVLAVLYLGGPTGAAAAGGVGALTTAGVAAWKRLRRGRPPPAG